METIRMETKIGPERNMEVARAANTPELILLRTLDGPVEHQDVALLLVLEHEHVLVLRLFDVEDLVHAERHGLTWPLRVRDLVEPAVCVRRVEVRWGPSGCEGGVESCAVPFTMGWVRGAILYQFFQNLA